MAAAFDVVMATTLTSMAAAVAVITNPFMDWFKLEIASMSVYYQRSAVYALVFSSKQMFLLGINLVFIIHWNLVYS